MYNDVSISYPTICVHVLSCIYDKVWLAVKYFKLVEVFYYDLCTLQIIQLFLLFKPSLKSKFSQPQ